MNQEPLLRESVSIKDKKYRHTSSGHNDAVLDLFKVHVLDLGTVHLKSGKGAGQLQICFA